MRRDFQANRGDPRSGQVRPMPQPEWQRGMPAEAWRRGMERAPTGAPRGSSSRAAANEGAVQVALVRVAACRRRRRSPAPLSMPEPLHSRPILRLDTGGDATAHASDNSDHAPGIRRARERCYRRGTCSGIHCRRQWVLPGLAIQSQVIVALRSRRRPRIDGIARVLGRHPAGPDHDPVGNIPILPTCAA